MTFMSWAAYLGAAISVMAGMLGLLFPMRVSRVIGVSLPARLGVSEFRATYGGLFIGAGAAVLVIGSREAALVLGLAWLGAFAARLLSVAVDRSSSRENMAGLVVELVFGLLLVL
ncbi:MAG: putative rane protein [Actinomycetota bacterium]|jgi:hypothetical protein